MFFNIFKGLSFAKNCLWCESAPLTYVNIKYMLFVCTNENRALILFFEKKWFSKFKRNWKAFQYFCLFGSPPLAKKGYYDFTTVSMSVCHVLSKTAHWSFLKIVMKLGCLKGKKLTEPDFFGKKLILGIMPKNTPKIMFFGLCKKNSPLMCRFFGFKSCTIVTFMILFKPHFWEKSVELNA